MARRPLSHGLFDLAGRCRRLLRADVWIFLSVARSAFGLVSVTVARRLPVCLGNRCYVKEARSMSFSGGEAHRAWRFIPPFWLRSGAPPCGRAQGSPVTC